MSEKDGGPAFPGSQGVNGNGGYVPRQGPNGEVDWELMSPGMTMRDFFAAKAMQAMITKSSGEDPTGGKKGVPLIAKFAYEFADAMLEARKS